MERGNEDGASCVESMLSSTAHHRPTQLGAAEQLGMRTPLLFSGRSERGERTDPVQSLQESHSVRRPTAVRPWRQGPLGGSQAAGCFRDDRRGKRSGLGLFWRRTAMGSSARRLFGRGTRWAAAAGIVACGNEGWAPWPGVGPGAERSRALVARYVFHARTGAGSGSGRWSGESLLGASRPEPRAASRNQRSPCADPALPHTLRVHTPLRGLTGAPRSARQPPMQPNRLPPHDWRPASARRQPPGARPASGTRTGSSPRGTLRPSGYSAIAPPPRRTMDRCARTAAPPRA